MRLHAVEGPACRQLDVPVAVVLADAGVSSHRLSNDERSRLDGFRFEARRRDWLVGRAALKELLPILGRDRDTGVLSFPDRQLSLTHGASGPGDTGAGPTIAVAAGTNHACAGIGVDYEPIRPVDATVGRWFLDESEIDWLDAQPRSRDAVHLVRLWTVKEAAYKSHPRNAARTFHEFAIVDPAASDGTVCVDGSHIRVFTQRFASGYLSIAINEES